MGAERTMTWWAELVSGEDPVADLQMAEIRDIERGRGREREETMPVTSTFEMVSVG